MASTSWSHANFADRFELVQARDNPVTDYERIVVAVAEGIIASRRVPKAGSVYTDAVVSARLPDLAVRMPHATLIFPYSWEHFSSAKLSGGVRVWFMQVVPIFEIERKVSAAWSPSLWLRGRCSGGWDRKRAEWGDELVGIELGAGSGPVVRCELEVPITRPVRQDA